MACLVKIVERGQHYDDNDAANKWKWEWLSSTVQVKVGDTLREERIGTRFRKIDVCGSAWCLLSIVQQGGILLK